jgi:hypothetical protein
MIVGLLNPAESYAEQVGPRLSGRHFVFITVSQHPHEFGITADCPSNVTDNTSINNSANLVFLARAATTPTTWRLEYMTA